MKRAQGPSLKECYSIVGVLPTAGLEEVKKAYRKRALELHPDMNPQAGSEASRKFHELNEAYVTLLDYISAQDAKEAAEKAAKEAMAQAAQKAKEEELAKRAQKEETRRQRQEAEKQFRDEKEKAEREKREEERREKLKQEIERQEKERLAKIAEEKARQERLLAERREREARERAERLEREARLAREKEEALRRAREAAEKVAREKKAQEKREEEMARRARAEADKTSKANYTDYISQASNNNHSSEADNGKKAESHKRTYGRHASGFTSEEEKKRQAAQTYKENSRDELFENVLNNSNRAVYDTIRAQTTAGESMFVESASPVPDAPQENAKPRKFQVEWGDKAYAVDLTGGIGKKVKGWLRSQIDEEQVVIMPPTALFAGARIRLQIRTAGLRGELRTIEIALPPDFAVGKPVRLKGMGKKVGSWQGDLYLTFQAK